MISDLQFAVKTLWLSTKYLRFPECFAFHWTRGKRRICQNLQESAFSFSGPGVRKVKTESEGDDEESKTIRKELGFPLLNLFDSGLTVLIPAGLGGAEHMGIAILIPGPESTLFWTF